MDLYNFAVELFQNLNVRFEQFSTGTYFVAVEHVTDEHYPYENTVLDVMVRDDGTIEVWTFSTQKYLPCKDMAAVKRLLRKTQRQYELA